MQFCDVSVRIGGKTTQVVSSKRVSVAEIQILRAIHGEDAVVDIVPKENRAVSSAEERERLKRTYEPAQVEEQRNLVARVFGPVGPLPQTLTDIGIDPQEEAQRMRERARDLADAAAALDAAEDQGEEVSLDGEDAPLNDGIDYGDDAEAVVQEAAAPRRGRPRKNAA